MKHIIKHRVTVTSAQLNIFAAGDSTIDKTRSLPKDKEGWWYDTPTIQQAVQWAVRAYINRSKVQVRLSDTCNLMIRLTVERRYRGGELTPSYWMQEVTLGDPRFGRTWQLPKIERVVQPEYGTTTITTRKTRHKPRP